MRVMLPVLLRLYIVDVCMWGWNLGAQCYSVSIGGVVRRALRGSCNAGDFWQYTGVFGANMGSGGAGTDVKMHGKQLGMFVFVCFLQFCKVAGCFARAC